MKTCSKCKYTKQIEEFAWKSKKTQTRSVICKQCHREYSRQHYKKNTTKYIEKSKVTNAVQRDRCYQYLIDYLKANPCVDCGETDIDVLEFDHIEMIGSKGLRVTSMIGSFNKMVAEIEKCEVRCCNCHTRRTRRMLGTSRYMGVWQNGYAPDS